MPRTPFNAKATTALDPNSGQPKTRSGGTGDADKRGEYATVISYNTDTYTATVRTERGRTLPGLQQMRPGPGSVITLEPGTEVLVSYDYGVPIIMGCVASPASLNDSDTPFSVTDVSGFGGQGDNKSLNLEEGNYRKASEPTDLLPGDCAQVGVDGNSIACLGAGVNVIRSSSLSQVKTHLINDLVEILSRNFRHITDMGISEITNNDGKINWSFRGGTDQRNEAGPDEENWSIRFDLGSEGDILNFELTTPQGQTLFRLHVDAEGHCEIYGVNGVDINSGSQVGGVKSEEITGSKRTVIGGDNANTVSGDESTTVSGSSTNSILSDYEVAVGNDARINATRDVAIGAGRNMNVAVLGNPPNFTDDALTFDVDIGNFVVDVGAIITPLGGINMSTYTGDINFTTQLGGDVVVDAKLGNFNTTSLGVQMTTPAPDSVILGGAALVSHVAKFEELNAYINALHTALDNHMHLITGTAQAGPFTVVGTSGLPVVPISAAPSALVALIRSLYVGVGG